MSKKKIQSLEDLKKVKFKKDPNDIYQLPYKKDSTPEPEPEQPEPSRDAELFLSAMQGVDKLDGDTGRQVDVRSEPPVPPAPAQDDAQVMSSFLRGDLEFELEYTDEYMYGFVRGLDSAVFQQLKNGAFSMESHLDLHGMTTEQAMDGLLFFLRENYLQNRRCVLVVTGRGINSPGGFSVLKREIQGWLTRDPLKRVILAFCTAQPKHGGAGALYVLLRRQKKTKGKVRWDTPLPFDDQ